MKSIWRQQASDCVAPDFPDCFYDTFCLLPFGKSAREFISCFCLFEGGTEKRRNENRFKASSPNRTIKNNFNGLITGMMYENWKISCESSGASRIEMENKCSN